MSSNAIRAQYYWYMRTALVCTFVSIFGPLVRAQDIRIKVIDGRNGRPASKECLNISVGNWHGADIVAETDKNGIAVLHLADSELTAEVACPGWPLRASAGEIQAIVVVSGSSVTCQEYGGKPSPGELANRHIPSYSVKDILASGVVAANTCGKIKAQPQSGELILFVRPLTFLEKWKL